MNSKVSTEALIYHPASAVSINLAVIKAILLRDIKILAGASGLGLLVLLLMPLGHLIAVVIVFNVLGKLAPVGNDQIVYFGLSILPFVIFTYMSRQMILSVFSNRPLLFFVRVQVFDILIARGVLEAVNGIVVFIVIIVTLLIISNEFSPRDWFGVVGAVAATIYLAFCTGVTNALLTQAVPIWGLVFNLSIPLVWTASGIVFFPAAIPEPYLHWLALNPVLQCIEWLRYSYYENYPDTLIDIPYLFTVSTLSLGCSLAAERLTRRIFR